MGRFISHATEDKQVVARPLAKQLQENGLRIWFDEFTLTVGDSLRQSIDKGLAESRFGIVVVSPAFLNKHWPQQELNGLAAREVGGAKVILPVWYNISAAEIHKQSPMLADRLAVLWKMGLENVVGELLRAMRAGSGSGELATEVRSAEASRAAIDREIKQVEHRPPPRKPDTVGFSERFAQAFPGVRETKWFDSEIDIVQRLSILLAEPLDYPEIWWWRGGNCQIESFQHQKGLKFLMDVYELNVRRIAAVYSAFYYRQYVYVELNAMEPTGLYSTTADSIANLKHDNSTWGYVWEEYGLVDNSIPVSREEYDDGAAMISGKIVDIRGRVKLRVRYVTPYNFLIAPRDSPINNHDFDYILSDRLDEILRGASTMEQLSEEIARLPRK
jgi:TIR domain